MSYLYNIYPPILIKSIEDRQDINGGQNLCDQPKDTNDMDAVSTPHDVITPMYQAIRTRLPLA